MTDFEIVFTYLSAVGWATVLVSIHALWFTFLDLIG